MQNLAWDSEPSCPRPDDRLAGQIGSLSFPPEGAEGLITGVHITPVLHVETLSVCAGREVAAAPTGVFLPLRNADRETT